MNRRARGVFLVPPLLAVGLAILSARPEVTAQDKKRGASDGGGGLRKTYFGTSTCRDDGCHSRAEPIKVDERAPKLCRCNELTTWEGKDKHADAYRVLEGKHGSQILKSLNIDLKAKGRAKECLACHAVVMDAEVKQVKFGIEEGVSCVVCHGAHGEWVNAHIAPIGKDEFRVLRRPVKEAQYGMTDLWDPVRRARLCASCHVGNAAEGKVVTHDMYAAGHPPLPGFEIASFSNQMPRHWQYLAEKPEAVQRLLQYDGKTQEQAKLVLVGAAVSLAEYARVVATQATASLKADDEDRKVLDWASFDCWSCHHDLKSPSWRQARGYPGKPGRVPLKAWPAELVRLALGHLGEDPADFERLWGELQAAAVSRPFGDNARMAKAAATLAAWGDGLAKKLNESSVDAAAARRLLEKLPEAVKKDPDYDSARQLGWAYRVIWQEQSRGKEDPGALVRLTAELGLSWPEERMPKGGDGVIVRDLGKSLKRLNDYDPAQFLRLWRGLPRPGK